MTSEIPKWNEPDPRKILAVRTLDRTTSLRNAATPIRQEVYHFIEGEIFPETGTTRLRDGQKPVELAEELLEQLYEKLYIWVVNLNINSGITDTDASMFRITINGGNKTIKPGKTLTIKVAFKPTSMRAKTSALKVTSNDPDAPTIDIPLSGTGE